MVANELNKKKYENAVLYFVKYCNNRYLGKTKLNKLMYYLDFISYRDRERSITNDKYVHKDYGPVPHSIDDIIMALNKKNQIDIQFEPWNDFLSTKFISRSDPDVAVFNDYEINLLEKICQEFQLWSTDKIVNQTHLEGPWFYSKPYEIVDYNLSDSIDFFRKEEQDVDS